MVYIPSCYLYIYLFTYLLIIRPFLGEERELFLHCGCILPSEDKRLHLPEFGMPVTISVMAFPDLFQRPDLSQCNGCMFKLFYPSIWVVCYRRLYSRSNSIQWRTRHSRNWESVVVAQAELALQPKNSTRRNMPPILSDHHKRWSPSQGLNESFNLWTFDEGGSQSKGRVQEYGVKDGKRGAGWWVSVGLWRTWIWCKWFRREGGDFRGLAGTELIFFTAVHKVLCLGFVTPTASTADCADCCQAVLSQGQGFLCSSGCHLALPWARSWQGTQLGQRCALITATLRTI